MLLFSFLLLPLVLTLYCLLAKEKRNLIVIFLGVFSSTLLCAVQEFVLFSHRLVPYSFGQNLLFYFPQTLVMTIVVYGLFILLTKDEWDFKIKSFFPLIMSFYSIYLPYTIIGFSNSKYAAYYIFLKPLLYLAMILICYFYLKKFYKNLLEKKVPLSIFSMTIFLVSLIFPAIVESLYVINSSIAIVLILSILFILFSIFLVYTNKFLKKE